MTDDLPPMRPVDPERVLPSARQPWQVLCLSLAAVVGVGAAVVTLVLDLFGRAGRAMQCWKQPDDCGPTGSASYPVLAFLLVLVGFGIALLTSRRRRWSWLFLIGCLVLAVGPAVCLMLSLR